MRKVILLLVLTIIFKIIYSQSEIYSGSYPLVHPHGAPTDGSSAAFSTTTFTGYSIEFNPALLSLNKGISFNASSQKYDLGSWWFDHGYYSFIYGGKSWGLGIGYRYWEMSEAEYFDWSTYAISVSSGIKISRNMSIGITLTDVIDRYTYDTSTLATDLGIYFSINKSRQKVRRKISLPIITKKLLTKLAFEADRRKPPIEIGIALRNIGPGWQKSKSGFPVDDSPKLHQTFNLGLSWNPIATALTRFSMGVELENSLISSYPTMDWDGDYRIGGYDEEGHIQAFGDYNNSGQRETAHLDSWFKSILTSWADDWFLGGDQDLAPSDKDTDTIIGGWSWNDTDNDGVVDLYDGEMIRTHVEPGSDGWGPYNQYGQKEVGNFDGSFKKQLDSFTYRLGTELDLTRYLSLKIGQILTTSHKEKVFTYGFSIGPPSLKYHFSKWINKDGFWAWDQQTFHAIEINLSKFWH